MREANFYASSCLYWLCGFIWLHNGPLRTLLGGPSPQHEAPHERPGIGRSLGRIVIAVFVFYAGYFVYSMSTGKERMTQVCEQIRSGTPFDQLRAFAEEHGLDHQRLNRDTKVIYLAEKRTIGHYACRVDLEDGIVRAAAYNFAD